MNETAYYKIEAHSYGILGAASHDFWVLRGPDGTIKDELHGLAAHSSTDKYEDAIPIGTIGDQLGFYAGHLRYGDISEDHDFAVMY